MGAERGQLTLVCSLEDPTGEVQGSDWGSLCTSTPFLTLPCDDSDSTSEAPCFWSVCRCTPFLILPCDDSDSTSEAPCFWSVCRSTPFLILACDDSDLLLAVLAWIDPDSRWSDVHSAGLSKPLGAPVLRIAVGAMLDLAMRRP